MCIFFFALNAHSKAYQKRKKKKQVTKAFIDCDTCGDISGWLLLWLLFIACAICYCYFCYCWHNHILGKRKHMPIFHVCIIKPDSWNQVTVLMSSVLSFTVNGNSVCMLFFRFLWDIIREYIYIFHTSMYELYKYPVFFSLFVCSLHSLFSNRFSRRCGHTKNKMENTHNPGNGIEGTWEISSKNNNKNMPINCLQSLVKLKNT